MTVFCGVLTMGSSFEDWYCWGPAVSKPTVCAQDCTDIAAACCTITHHHSTPHTHCVDVLMPSSPDTAGPTTDPDGGVTCTAVAPAPLTDALGTATWTCTTGQTPGKVTLTVEAPNLFSSELHGTTATCTGSMCWHQLEDLQVHPHELQLHYAASIKHMVVQCGMLCIGSGRESEFYHHPFDSRHTPRVQDGSKTGTCTNPGSRNTSECLPRETCCASLARLVKCSCSSTPQLGLRSLQLSRQPEWAAPFSHVGCCCHRCHGRRRRRLLLLLLLLCACRLHCVSFFKPDHWNRLRGLLRRVGAMLQCVRRGGEVTDLHNCKSAEQQLTPAHCFLMKT